MSEPRERRAPEPDPAWWAETDTVAALDFGLAVSIADFEGAFQVLHKQYVWRRYMAPEPSGRRVNVHNLLLSTKVIVARAGARVVGTMAVVEDSRLGLPMDDAFGPELHRVRARGWRLVEGASLAIDSRYRASGVPILLRLLRVATLYSALIARADALSWVIHVRHREFYEALYPFRWFGPIRRYRRINSGPTHGLYLDLRLARAMVRIGRAGFSAGPLNDFMFSPQVVADITGRLRRELPRSTLTPPEWARLFAEASGPEPAQAEACADDRPSADDGHDQTILTALVSAVHIGPGGDR